MLKRADTESAVEEAHKYNVDSLQKGLTERDDIINLLREENEKYRQEQRERVESENASLRAENEALKMKKFININISNRFPRLRSMSLIPTGSLNSTKPQAPRSIHGKKHDPV